MNIEEVKRRLENYKDIKQSSLKAYISTIKTLQKNCNINDFSKLNEELIISYINTKKTLSTKNNYYKVYSLLLQIQDKIDAKKIYEIQSIITQKNKDYQKSILNKKSTKEEEKWCSIQDLKDKVNKIKEKIDLTKENPTKKELNEIQKFIIGSCYVMYEEHPPIRLGYKSIIVINEEDYDSLTEEEFNNKNYLVLNNDGSKDFHFADYKTDEVFGIKVLNVCKELNALLDIWLNYVDNENMYLFYNYKYGKEFNKITFSKYVSNIFDGVNVNIIRKIFITEKLKEPSKQVKDMANRMFHTISTQQTHYLKND